MKTKSKVIDLTATEDDPANLSAFAVYNNKVPGVKVYTDTNNPTKSQRKKNKKKRKKVEKVEEPAVEEVIILDNDTNKSKNTKKKTSTKRHPVNGYENDTTVSSKGNIDKPKTAAAASEHKGSDKNGSPLKSQASESSDVKASMGKKKKKKKSSFDNSEKFLLNPLARNETEDLSSVQKDKKGKKRKKSLNNLPETPSQNGVHSDENDEVTSAKKPHLEKSAKVKDAAPVSPMPLVPVSSKSNFIKMVKEAELFSEEKMEDSFAHGKFLLEWLVSPTNVESFMDQYWEKEPLLVKRHETCPGFYDWLRITSAKIDNIFRTNSLKYGKNVDVTSFQNDMRETISDSLEGRVRPAVIWDYYSNGCSIRMLNPQTYMRQLWRLNSSLQEFFGTFVGANLYLTPGDSQGFAPHYDDIEAFIIQLEGKKRWRLYKPRKPEEELPRFSSGNFSEEADDIGDPILDVILEEGDLLYFPRGIIHQANTVDGTHSLHVTISSYQMNTWGDLLKTHLLNSVDKLCSSDVNFRKGLPHDYLSYMGIAHQETEDEEISQKRKEFQSHIKMLMKKVMNESADFAADQMGKKFIWDSLPPYLSRQEKSTTVVEDGEFMENGNVFNTCEMDPDVEIKLVRKNVVRLVAEENTLRLYHSIENPLVYHEDEPNFLELDVKFAPAIQHLITKYPEFTRLEDLPMAVDDISEKIQLAADLWEKGLVLTKNPLEAANIDFEEDSDCSELDSENENTSRRKLTKQQNKDKDNAEDVESINLSDLEEFSDGGEEEDIMRDHGYMLQTSSEDSESEDDDSENPFNYEDVDSDEEFEEGENGVFYVDEDDEYEDVSEDDDDDDDELDESDDSDSD